MTAGRNRYTLGTSTGWKGPGAPMADTAAVRQVLVLLDGTRRAEGALPRAVEQARSLDASIRLLQILPPRLPFGGISDERERSAWMYLGTVADGLRVDGISVSFVVRRGFTIPTLLDDAGS